MRRSLPVCLVLFTAFVTASLASAQTATTGTVVGTVSDQSGARLPGATIEAVDLATNTTVNVLSSETGQFTFRRLGRQRRRRRSDGAPAHCPTSRLGIALPPGRCAAAVWRLDVSGRRRGGRAIRSERVHARRRRHLRARNGRNHRSDRAGHDGAHRCDRGVSCDVHKRERELRAFRGWAVHLRDAPRLEPVEWRRVLVPSERQPAGEHVDT